MDYLKINDVVAGDHYPIRRTFTGVPAGSAVTKAWLTVKAPENVGAPPDDTLAKFQKVVTTTPSPTNGVIENDGSVGGAAVVRFDLQPADTVLLRTDGRWDYFDVQLLVGGQLVTPIQGDMSALLPVTRATS